MNTDVDPRQGIGGQIKLPWDSGCSNFELPEISRLELFNPHQDSTSGSQVQVGPITIYEAAPEFHPAWYNGCAFYRKIKGLQFLITNRFKTGNRDDKICSNPPNHMAFDTFC